MKLNIEQTLNFYTYGLRLFLHLENGNSYEYIHYQLEYVREFERQHEPIPSMLNLSWVEYYTYFLVWARGLHMTVNIKVKLKDFQRFLERNFY